MQVGEPSLQAKQPSLENDEVTDSELDMMDALRKDAEVQQHLSEVLSDAQVKDGN